jgi:hypothetical protein
MEVGSRKVVLVGVLAIRLMPRLRNSSGKPHPLDRSLGSWSVITTGSSARSLPKWPVGLSSQSSRPCPGSFPHRVAKERLRGREAIRARGYPSRTSPNREATSCTGWARQRNRSGRMRDLRAKPAEIWAKASKKKRSDREVESVIYA